MRNAWVVPEAAVPGWLDALARRGRLVGPRPPRRGQTAFGEAAGAAGIDLDYCSTMLGPQVFLYPTVQALLRMDLRTGAAEEAPPPDARGVVLFGVHPCDMQAITVLDRTFLARSADPPYAKARREAATVVLNCRGACGKGFCESMGTGPFLRLRDGYDLEATRLEGRLLLEAATERGAGLAALAAGRREPVPADLDEKALARERARASFAKRLDVRGLPELLMRNWDHPVYRETADSRCLGCTNCTMVCPTCYCWSADDEMDFAQTTAVRTRSKDSCQELHFAAVHGGNFRETRTARLRQFVTHKLCTWLEQYGCFGCVGCGRCMTWCPTEIDLSDMAKRIQEDFERGRAR